MAQKLPEPPGDRGYRCAWLAILGHSRSADLRNAMSVHSQSVKYELRPSRATAASALPDRLSFDTESLIW